MKIIDEDLNAAFELLGEAADAKTDEGREWFVASYLKHLMWEEHMRLAAELADQFDELEKQKDEIAPADLKPRLEELREGMKFVGAMLALLRHGVVVYDAHGEGGGED